MSRSNNGKPAMASGRRRHSNALLKMGNLTKHYAIREGFLRRVVGHVHAVENVSLDVYPGETLGLVGESGCGKTTLAKMLVRATQPTTGTISLKLNDRLIDVARATGDELGQLRRHVQMVFQNPYSSLNPRHRVRDIIGEPLLVNGVARGRQLEGEVSTLMSQVGLQPEHAIRYPHAFSGGQRQRIGIARALALNPRLIICDEPVSALDMSIQAQILNLLKDLQDERGLTYIVISHDLGVVRHISDRVAVMYLGKVVELAPTKDLFRRPRHPYTAALLAASPKPHPRHRGEVITISGELPDPTQPPKGCPFQTRCAYTQDRCRSFEPPLQPSPDNGRHQVACHYADALDLGVARPSSSAQRVLTGPLSIER